MEEADSAAVDALLGDGDGDPGDTDVYGIADMLLEGSDEDRGHVTTADGEEAWINPLTSIQAYSVEPQVLLQEMLDNDDDGHDGEFDEDGGGDGYEMKEPVKQPNIIQIDPSTLDDENEGDDEVTVTGVKLPQSELVSMLAQSLASEVMEKETKETQSGQEERKDSAGEKEPVSEPVEEIQEDQSEEEVDTFANDVEEEEEDVEAIENKPHLNIVSVDPTAFDDAKVKEMVRQDSEVKDVGRRSKHKQNVKPKKRREDQQPEEPPSKKQKKEDLKLTISLKNIKTEEPPAPVVKRGPGRPRKRPFGEPAVKPKPQRVTKLLVKPVQSTGRPRGRPRGRPPKSGRVPTSRPLNTVQIKEEPAEEGYGDDMGIDHDPSDDYCPFEGRPRRSKRNAKTLKGTHIMHFKEYRCFECNDDRMYTDKEAFLEHWRGAHFDVQEDGANLYCSDCNQKFSVNLQRFHRAADVLQYVAFYFNHRIKRHVMQVPPYIEEFRCTEEGCPYVTYTSYAMARHIQEGKHKPMRRYMPSLIGSSLPSKGFNKYALNFKEFKCFVCSDDKKYSDLTSLLVHWRENHFQFTDEEAVIVCGYCGAEYKISKARYHRQTHTMQYIAYFFSHLVKKHNIQVPSYIEQLQCDEPGCKFITYTRQLLQRHLQEVKHVNLSRTPALDSAETGGLGQRSPYLSFREYRCFMCVGEDGLHQGPFENGAVMAEHWRQVHFVTEPNRALLQCSECPMQYHIHHMRFARNADVLMMISRYFAHMVKKHTLQAPEYIELFKCPVEGCGYTCFTPQILDGHRKTKRDPAHMGVEAEGDNLELGAEQMPELSLRHLNKGHQNAEKPVKQKTDQNEESSSPVKKELAISSYVSLAVDKDILSMSKKIADGVLQNFGVDGDDVDSPDKALQTVDLRGLLDQSSSLNQSTSREELEENIDTSDMKAKSLLCFTQIQCFECGDGKVYANHHKHVDHWRKEHFNVGKYEVYITCSVCQTRIGLNKPLWHRDHDIGRCIASYLTHKMKKHKYLCPEYVKELECPEPGCGYKTLTVKHMQFHVRHTKHHKLEKAKQAAAGLNPSSGVNAQEYARRYVSFRMNDNGLTFKEYQCYICGDGVFYKNCIDYENHWREKHVTLQGNKESISCHICDTKFISHLYPSIAFLFCHLVKKHEFEVPWYIEEYACEEEHCNYTTYTKALLAKHKTGQRHSSGSGIFQYYLNFKEYRCMLCAAPNVVYASKRMFESHLMRDHIEKRGDGGEYFRCPECNHHFMLHYCRKPEMNYEKADPSRTLCVLYNHIVTKHKWDVPNFLITFSCEYEGCGYTTVRKYNLDKHVASHTADQQCYQCGMFFSKPRLEKHIKKCLLGQQKEGHTIGNRSLPCPDCGMSILNRKCLRKHMQEVHGKGDEELPLQKKRRLRASETGIAYQCVDCGKVLLERKSMKRHMLSVHLKRVEGKDLQAIRHEVKKDDEELKQYECMLCGVQMGLMKSVKRHMMKQHGIKVTSQRDLETSYVKVDSGVPVSEIKDDVTFSVNAKGEKKATEFTLPIAQGLTTIDDSEISDFAVASRRQGRPYTAASPEPNPAAAAEEEPGLVEMTPVQHYIDPTTALKLAQQQSIFPSAKPVTDPTPPTTTNQALDFSMRLPTEIDPGAITNSNPLLSQSRLPVPPSASAAATNPQQTITLSELQHNPGSIISIAARHIQNGQSASSPGSIPVTSAAHRVELLQQRLLTPQTLPGTIDPRDISAHLPVEFTSSLFGQRLPPTTHWNLPNQS